MHGKASTPRPETLNSGRPGATAIQPAAPQHPSSVAAQDAGGERHELSRLQRFLTLMVIVLPFAGLVVAMALAWQQGFDWIQLTLLAVMYVATGLGITVGYHRYFTHKSFSTGPVMQTVLGVLGSMAAEGSILSWVAAHRCHHQHSDRDDDPHSPHNHEGGFLNIMRGFFRAHMGWFFEPSSARLMRYVVDLRQSRLIRVLSALFPLWVVLGLLLPAAAGGLLTWSWSGALMGFIWGGLVRIFLVHHVTWSINSVCHIWGTRPFNSHDESRNNVIFGVLGFGEGWHNNHHAFPASARHGLRWWEVDVSYLVILAMSKVGLAWNVRVPDAERIASKRR